MRSDPLKLSSRGRRWYVSRSRADQAVRERWSRWDVGPNIPNSTPAHLKRAPAWTSLPSATPFFKQRRKAAASSLPCVALMYLVIACREEPSDSLSATMLASTHAR